MNNPNTTDDRMVNVAQHLCHMAQQQPYKRAVVCPAGRDGNGRISYAHMTFEQLDRESDRIAHGFESVGITRGTRTILMLKPSLDFFAVTFAFFKLGAVPVVVDPGMGLRRMLICLKESRPQALIGIPAAHILRVIGRNYFTTLKTWITVGRRLFWSGPTLRQLQKRDYRPFKPVKTGKDETAAILFTTGSTGPAKGVVYTHGIFDAQVRHIQTHFEITPDEIDLPTFPLFALFDPALGMTAIIPEMDPTKPAQVNPLKIFEPIINHGVTNMFASPALLNRVGRYAAPKGLKLPSLKRVVSAGAPVAPIIIERFASLLENGAEIHTPYGATEAVPIISIGSREILSETKKFSEQGYGMCVGRPLNGLDVEIIRISDAPIQKWSSDLAVQTGEVGEIVVKGDLVTAQYFERPEANTLAKIVERTPAGVHTWHRMGDLGWRDAKGRIWFCGRKNQRVITTKGTLYTIPCEAIFNNHPAVFRSALVGVKDPPDQLPVICIELEKKLVVTKKSIQRELLEIAHNSELTKTIKNLLFIKSFPVDIRHNSKIFREKLKLLAEKKFK